jgi:putative FmdB family regulatory protein
VPLYEYECEACGKRFEVIQKSYSEAPVEVCKFCGKGPVQRLMSSPAIQFKGSGWYITDYAKKSGADAGSAGSSAKGDGEKKSDTAATSDTAAKADTPAKSDSSKSDSSKSDSSKGDSSTATATKTKE